MWYYMVVVTHDNSWTCLVAKTEQVGQDRKVGVINNQEDIYNKPDSD